MPLRGGFIYLPDPSDQARMIIAPGRPRTQFHPAPRRSLKSHSAQQHGTSSRDKQDLPNRIATRGINHSTLGGQAEKLCRQSERLGPRPLPSWTSAQRRKRCSLALTCCMPCRRNISSSGTMSLCTCRTPPSLMMRRKASCMPVAAARMP